MTAQARFRGPRSSIWRWFATIFAVLVLGAVSVACGVVVVVTEGLDIPRGVAEAALIGTFAGGLVILAGPVPCLAATAALGVLGWTPTLLALGGVNLTAADVFYLALVAWWLGGGAPARRGESETKPVPLRYGFAVAVLAVAGLTLLKVWIVDPAFLSTSVAAWIRLVQTATLVWLAAQVLGSLRDVTLVVNAMLVSGVVAVGVALVEAAGSGFAAEGTRYGGSLGVNSLGLVAGVLVLFSCFPSHKSSTSQRAVVGVAGLLGLLLAKSVGSILGIAVAVAVGVLWISASGTRWRGLTALGLAACIAVTAVAAVQLLRPESLPTSTEFSEGSTYHRIVLGAAGLELFRGDPVIGVGWRRSSSPDVIGSTEVADALRSRFEAAPNDFFPDVDPGSVHNAYIQILAELGLVGFVLFVAAIVNVGLGIRALLARCVAPLGTWRAVRFFALGLILVAVWWNDNPIYGGQTETIVLAVSLGCISALAGLQHPPAASRARA